MGFLTRVDKFFADDLWKGATASGPRRLGGAWTLRILRVLVLAYEGFIADLCLLRATALTTSCLMALVPMMALSFALLRGLGWTGQRLEALILEKVTVLDPDGIATVVQYIDNTNAAGLGVLGGLVLLFTCVSVMATVEMSFNAIWGDAPERPLLRKLGGYSAVMVFAPLLLAFAVSLTTALRSNSTVAWTFGPTLGPTLADALALLSYSLVWLVFAFLYMFVPAAKVRAVPALIGGVIAGTVWQSIQMAYVTLQIGVVGYNAVYGVMAQLPLLMIWFYISWLIVLAGAEISSAVQNLEVATLERRRALVGYAEREYLGLRLVVALAQASLARRKAPTLEDLAEENELPYRNLLEVVGDLKERGVVHEGGEQHRSLFLSLAPSSLPVAAVLSALRGDDGAEDLSSELEVDCVVTDLLAELHSSRSAVVGALTVADLIERAQPAAGVDAG